MKKRYLLIAFSLLSCHSEVAYDLVSTGESFSMTQSNNLNGFYHNILSVLPGPVDKIYYLSGEDTTLRITTVDSTANSFDVAEVLSARIPYFAEMVTRNFLENDSLLWVDVVPNDTLYRLNLNAMKVDRAIYRFTPRNVRITTIKDQIETYSEKNRFYLPTGDDSLAVMGLFKIEGDHFVRIKRIGQIPHNYYERDMRFSHGEFTRTSDSTYLISYYYNDERVKRICMRSDSSGEFVGYIGSAADMSQQDRFFAMRQRYTDLYFDSKHQRYYRVFSYEQPFNGKIAISTKWSISVFDSAFNKMCEKEFDAYSYDKAHVIMLNNKLYLPVSHWGIKPSSDVQVFHEFQLTPHDH